MISGSVILIFPSSLETRDCLLEPTFVILIRFIDSITRRLSVYLLSNLLLHACTQRIEREAMRH